MRTVTPAYELTRLFFMLVLLLVASCKNSEPANSLIQQSPQSSLWDAAMSGDVAALSTAIEEGADVNALDVRENPNGRRALNWAASYNHVDAIQILLANGAEINAVNRTGFTPLHHAAEESSPDAARVLIEAGADVNLPNNAGETPLERARREGHKEVASLLEKAGAKENVTVN